MYLHALITLILYLTSPLPPNLHLKPSLPHVKIKLHHVYCASMAPCSVPCAQPSNPNLGTLNPLPSSDQHVLPLNSPSHTTASHLAGVSPDFDLR